MQKQLVLAALFATVNAAECTDANVVMAKASKAALTAATAGLTSAKAAALAAQGLSNTAVTNAEADVLRWTTAMSAYTAEKTKAVDRAAAQVTVASNAKAALDLIQVSETNANGSACSSCVAANALLPLKKAQVAKTAADLVVSGTGGVTLNAKDAAAAAIVAELLTNKTDHNTIQGAMSGLRGAAKQTWDDAQALNVSGTLVAAAKLKFSAGQIMVTGVTSKKSETLMKCNGSTPAIGYAASGAGAIWTSGSHNSVEGAANASGDAAKEYLDNYLDCATIGYSTIVAAKKLISGKTGAAAGNTNATFDTWHAAQVALETKAYRFGKLLHACMAGATYAKGNVTNYKMVAATPCMRSGRFERTYKDAYAGAQGKPGATIPIAATVANTGKIGDYAADGGSGAAEYTSSSAIAEHVKATTASGVGTAADGLFLTRDTAYAAWLLKVIDTADAIVTENIAKIEYRRLQLLGTAYVLAVVSGANTKLDAAGLVKTASLAAVGTESRVYELALNKKVQDGLDLGVGSDKVTGDTAAIAARSNARMSSADMVTLGNAMKVETAGYTAAKGTATISAATLLTKAYLQASLNFNVANTKLVQATADYDRSVTARGLITTAITAAKTDKTIKQWQFDNENRRFNLANTANTVAQALKLKLDAGLAVSNTIGAKANIKGNFYKDVETKAKAMQVVSNTAYNNASTALATNVTDLASASTRETLAISQCKAVGYKKAQDALSSINAAKATDASTAATTKTAYDKLSARPASTAEASPAGSDCSFGAVVDGTPAPRSKCAEGLCCGAANKYLRDGTKLTVETCQKTDVISYTFYPQLKAGATVAPVAEQWRFSCISGAKNLAATATAALAAAYLMA